MGYRENLVTLEARLVTLRRELVCAEELAADARAIASGRTVEAPLALRSSRWIAIIGASALCAALAAWLFDRPAPVPPAEVVVTIKPTVYRATMQRTIEYVPCNGCFDVLAWPSRISATGLRPVLSVEHELPR